MNEIHAGILVHWTKPLFGTQGSRSIIRADGQGGVTGTSASDTPLQWHQDREPTDADRQGYIARLTRIYRYGLRANVPLKRDVIQGAFGNCATLRLPLTGMVCFTELRLNHSGVHAQKYGRLGIGFEREFLLARGANPVFYMQSADQGIINTNIAAYINAGGSAASEILAAFEAHIKPMSEPCATEFDQYDEMEWRLVPMPYHMKGMESAAWPPCFEKRSDGIYIPFDATDVKLLVMPDEDTRKRALQDRRLKQVFRQYLPMMVDFTQVGRF